MKATEKPRPYETESNRDIRQMTELAIKRRSTHRHRRGDKRHIQIRITQVLPKQRIQFTHELFVRIACRILFWRE